MLGKGVGGCRSAAVEISNRKCMFTLPTPLTLQNLGYFVSDIAELGLRQLFLFSDNALKYEISLTRWSIDTGIRWQLFGLNTVSDCRHSCGVCTYIPFYTLTIHH